MKATLVLDTNTFDARGFPHWLRGYLGRKVLPIVAYVELGVYFRNGGRYEQFRALLNKLDIEVEWLRVEEAERAILAAAESGGFSERARDFMIGAHAAAPGRVMVTLNVRDFHHLENVTTPAQLMQGHATAAT